MKKRFQPSFASLTEDEIEQLACMTQRETFAVVLERARKPRSEGGFGLTFRSESPLERLLDKKNKLDLINARIKDGKKLTLADLNTFTAGEHRAPEEVHDAIMSATYILVTEHDNTPHQLLALQRLADFPARVELREQSAQIRAQSATDLSRLRNQSLAHRTERQQFARAREQRAIAKEQRAQQLHNLKIQNHGRGGERASAQAIISSGVFHPCPTSTSRDAITSTRAASADQNLSETTQHSALNTHHSRNHTAPQITDLLNTDHSPSAPSAPSAPSVPSVPLVVNSFLRPEVLANTRLYDQKVACGEIRHIFTPGKHYEIEYCNPADKPALERTSKSAPLRFVEDPTRTHYLPGLRTFGKNPYIPPQSSSP